MEGVAEYKVILSKRAQKDFDGLIAAGYEDKVRSILKRMESDPFYPPYEKLTLNLKGKCSRRINVKDRLVYEIRPSDNCKGIVYVLRMRGHHQGIYSLLAL